MERVMTTERSPPSLSLRRTMMNSWRSRVAFTSLEKYLTKTTVGWIAIWFGVFTAVAPAWAATTRAGAACTLGMGIFTAYYGALGLPVVVGARAT
jgi:hypothetical protein